MFLYKLFPFIFIIISLGFFALVFLQEAPYLLLGTFAISSPFGVFSNPSVIFPPP